MHRFRSVHARASRRLGELAAILIAAAAAGGFALLPSGTPPTAGAARVDPGATGTASSLAMAISPGSWTMMASTSAQFSVAIVGAPSDCSVAALSPTWGLPGNAAIDGFLNRSAGPSVTFTAFESAAGGLVELTVEGSVVLDCAGTEESDWAGGSASLTIVPTASLAGPFATPDPATPGAPVLLSWRLAGGLPPYEVSVAFGDGALSTFTQEVSGPGEVVHRFAAGSYQPTLSILDSVGHGIRGTIASPIPVSYGLAVTIEGPGPVVDRDRAFTLAANVTGGLPPYSLQWKGIGAPFLGSTWGLAIPRLGTFNATLDVTDLEGNYAQVSLNLHVVAPPSVNVSVPAAGCDAGVAFPVVFNVSGGAGPLRLSWGVTPSGPNGTATLPSDGVFLEPATAALAGAAWISASLVDALGSNESVQSPLAPVHPLPSTRVSVSPDTGEPGQVIRLTAVVTGGTPPFRWSILPSGPVGSLTADSGLLGAEGTVSWSGTLGSTGNLSLLAMVLDANGIETSANGSVRSLPGLRPVVAIATPAPTPGTSVIVGGLLDGGVPPYLYGWSTSDGESAVGNRTTPGPVTFTATPRAAGYLTVTLWISDALGAEANITTQVLVSVSGTAPTPALPAAGGGAAPPSWLWVAAGLLVVGGAFLGWKFRRPPGRSPPPPSPSGSVGMGVVRRLLQESGELDRETLSFLAEEEGIPTEVTSAAVERWTRAGKLRSETGTEGETLLRWVGSVEPISAEGRGAP
ncbi:MAG: hypothetical protein L3K19_02920 [Thermoplasmata archaeon]|nr:hypothetical protein [Thermoplasmata archaeon]